MIVFWIVRAIKALPSTHQTKPKNWLTEPTHSSRAGNNTAAQQIKTPSVRKFHEMT